MPEFDIYKDELLVLKDLEDMTTKELKRKASILISAADSIQDRLSFMYSEAARVSNELASRAEGDDKIRYLRSATFCEAASILLRKLDHLEMEAEEDS